MRSKYLLKHALGLCPRGCLHRHVSTRDTYVHTHTHTPGAHTPCMDAQAHVCVHTSPVLHHWPGESGVGELGWWEGTGRDRGRGRGQSWGWSQRGWDTVSFQASWGAAGWEGRAGGCGGAVWRRPSFRGPERRCGAKRGDQPLPRGTSLQGRCPTCRCSYRAEPARASLGFFLDSEFQGDLRVLPVASLASRPLRRGRRSPGIKLARQASFGISRPVVLFRIAISCRG